MASDDKKTLNPTEQDKQLTTYLLANILIPHDIRKHQGYLDKKHVFTQGRKYSSILYLLYLEYRSRLPGYALPPNSPFNNMLLMNSMSGVFAYHSFYSFESMFKNIVNGNIPKFSDIGFAPGEKQPLMQAIETIKKYVSPQSEDRISIIMDSHKLQLHWRFPWIDAEIEMTPKNVQDEVTAYLKYRNEIVYCKYPKIR